MNKKETLRWVAVLPAALLAGIIVTFPIHWILVFKFGVESWWVGFLEKLIAPFCSAWAFIHYGTETAPKHPIRVSYVLAGLWIVPVTILMAYRLIYGQMDFTDNSYIALNNSYLPVIGGIIGCIVAVFKIKEEHKNQ